MLIEIAAANLAFKTVSTLLKNGKQLYQIGSQMNDYLSASQKVKDKAGDANSRGTALEAYQFAEQERVRRSQLEFHLKKSRLNGWSDFVKFEAEWHRQRKEEEKEKINARIRRNNKLQKDISLAINIGICMIIAMGLLFGIAVYIRN
jgi:hypothetical protein